jgi:quinol monooxygenase YgiN
MSLHLLAALGGALIAAAGTYMLAARCLRVRNGALVAWTVAMFGLTVALAAQAIGYATGFGQVTFRAMELGAQVVAPLTIVLGMVELAAKKLPARFAARLVLAALALVAVVILGTDPLSGAAFSKAFPLPSVYYQIIPGKLLEYLLAPVTVLIALAAVLTAGARPGRDPAWRPVFPPVFAAGIAACLLALPGLAPALQDHLGITLPLASVFGPICVAAAALTWLAGMRAGRLRLDVLRDEAGAGDDEEEEWDSQGTWGGGAKLGDFEPLGVSSGYEDATYAGLYREPGAGDRSGYRDLSGQRDGTGQQAGEAGFPGEAGYRGGDGFPGEAGYGSGDGFPGEAGYGSGDGFPGEPGYPRPGGYDDSVGQHRRTAREDPGGYQEAAGNLQAARDAGSRAADRDRPDRASGGDPRENAQAFGQIAIYTLLEDRVHDFDRLTKEVVRKVRDQEPDTLVYIFHAVPGAPMQRILYEVYSDRTAYEEHRRQPYVLRFDADRRPYVLATNVIELGLKQAKVSQLPSISDVLSDTGFDLLSDTGFGTPGYGPRRAW